MKIIGHRGARGLAPENTLRSIAKALEYKVDEVEFDVRVTRDGVPVLHHDAAIIAGGEALPIRDNTFEELRRHLPELASLDEALSAIAGQVTAMVEVKPGEPATAVTEVVRAHLASGVYTVRNLLLGSKSQRTLRELHRELPDIPKVVIESWSGVRASYRARQVNTKRISMRASWLWRGFLRSMQHGGYEIAAYTVNDPAKVRRWQHCLDAVITDYPDRFQPQHHPKGTVK